MRIKECIRITYYSYIDNVIKSIHELKNNKLNGISQVWYMDGSIYRYSFFIDNSLKRECVSYYDANDERVIQCYYIDSHSIHRLM